jgi:hypothetical protein
LKVHLQPASTRNLCLKGSADIQDFNLGCVLFVLESTPDCFQQNQPKADDQQKNFGLLSIAGAFTKPEFGRLRYRRQRSVNPNSRSRRRSLVAFGMKTG